MNKKCIIMVAALFMSASPALAQQWKNLGTYGTSTYYFYNPKTLAVAKDQIVSTWTKREFDVDAAAMDKGKLGPDQYKGSKSVVAYEEFDCAKQKKRIVSGMSYDNEKNQNKDVSPTDWQGVLTGTLEGNLLEAVCRLGKLVKK